MPLRTHSHDLSRVLVPDYLGSQVLAGIRSLSKHCEVHHAWKYSPVQRFLRSSSDITHSYPLASLPSSPIAYAEDIDRLCNTHKYDAVIPFGLYSSYALATYPNKSQSLATMLPPVNSYLIANDKSLTHKLASSLGISVPFTSYNSTQNDLSHLAKEIGFPLVVKTRTGTGVDQGVRFAFNYDQLVRAWDLLSSSTSRTPGDNSLPIIQEFIPGSIHDLCSLSIHGKAQFLLTKLRELMFPLF